MISRFTRAVDEAEVPEMYSPRFIDREAGSFTRTGVGVSRSSQKDA
jgi:hypothetical protein